MATQPKRKSPDRKPAAKAPARKGPSVAMRALQSTAAGIARYPRMIGGTAIFGVVFCFVAANALWYQPRHHPNPMLATRMFESQKSKSANKGSDDAPEPGVTVFRIERQKDIEARAQAEKEAKPAASPLIKQIQQALAKKGLYDGPADGVTGPKTTAAILFFQETEGLDQTGEATPALLAKIKANDTDSNVAVIPDERPAPDEVTSSTKSVPAKADGDDVADLIRAVETDPKPAARPIKASVTKAEADSLSPAAIMQIQRALTKFAYADIQADGVVGEATRSAIRDFEKSYNMPVTGEPSERIVRKLKSIGAL
jgi:peptidoglycan hydrolase-like protein with peptidoglycan-binding domain